MRKSYSDLLFALFFFLLAGSCYAATNDPLAEYDQMITQALKEPVTQGDLQKGNSPLKNNVNNGQAALIPAAPVMPDQNYAAPAPVPNHTASAPYPNDSAHHNAANLSTAQQQPAAPAGPPNIFVTPNGNPANNQGSSVIHY